VANKLVHFDTVD